MQSTAGSETTSPEQAGGANPCPALNFTGGFNAFLAAAYGLPAGQTIKQKYGVPFGRACRFCFCL